MVTEKKLKILVEAHRTYASYASKKFTGRLVGVINAKECQALINTPGIARGIYSLPSLGLGEGVLSGPWIGEYKRFVIATDDFYNKYCRAIFISPVITWCYRASPSLEHRLGCRDLYEYRMKEILDNEDAK